MGAGLTFAPNNRGAAPLAKALRSVQTTISFGLIWYLLWNVSIVMGSVWQASLWYPPAALSVALFLYFRIKAVPMVALGCGLTAIQTAIFDQSGDIRQVLIWAGFTFNHSVVYGGFARILRWRRQSSKGRRDAAIPSENYTMLFAPVFCGAQTLLGLLNLWLFADISVDALIEIAPVRFCGDLIAVVTLTFPFYLLMRKRFTRIKLRISITALPYLAGVTLLFAGMTWLSRASGGTIPLSMVAYVQLLPLLYASSKLNNVSLYFLVAWAEIIFVLEAGMIGIPEHAMDYQGAMLTIASAAYIGSVISTLIDERAQLRQLATTDLLTGLLNRRAAIETIETELSRSRRRGDPISLAILDIDHFKKINDEFGHDAGDRALSLVSSALRDTVRSGDIVARWGGEEFLICFPDTVLNGAEEVCERCRSAIAQTRFAPHRRVTASFGLVQVRPQERLSDVITRADGLLYLAKAKGRDRIETERADAPTPFAARAGAAAPSA